VTVYEIVMILSTTSRHAARFLPAEWRHGQASQTDVCTVDCRLQPESATVDWQRNDGSVVDVCFNVAI